MVRLFKKNKTHNYSKKVPTYISYNDLNSLFSKHNTFNDDLLTKTLKIPKDYKYFFFDYCESQKINSNFLATKNEFLLLDTLIKLATDYLELN